jgi:hypothetical protein
MWIEQMLGDRLILDAALIIAIAIVLTFVDTRGRQGRVQR